jgi:hypothetical protein
VREAVFRATAERVRTTAEQAWQQPVTHRHLRRVRLRYDVPGRRTDGTIKGSRLIRRLLYDLVRVFGTLFLILTDVILGGFGEVGGRTRNGTVSGGADALALPFADAVRQGGRDLWLVGSDDHLAVFQARANSPVVSLWEAAGAQRPVNRKSYMAVQWPDGSSVTFNGPE